MTYDYFMKGLFITGTDTNVGKTYIACALARALSAENINVVPRKPVESGCSKQGNELIPADALALKQAADYTGDLELVCPYRFEPAISPDRAARLANTPLTIDQLKSACLKDTNPDTDFLLVEGAGGFYSPLCSDGLNADLAQTLGFPVLLVVEDRLGCINQLLLTIQAIESRQLELKAIILNRMASYQSDTLMDNQGDLQQMLDYPLFIQKYAINHHQYSLTKDLVSLITC